MNNNFSNTCSPRIRGTRRKRVACLFLVLGVLLMSNTLPSTVAEKKFTVVIDPGHGGSDPGNLGTGRLLKTEKDVSLDVALIVGEYIRIHYPEVQIVYTRKTDVFPTLARRVQIANEALADLFISIHCNANDNKGASGAETFVMGLHKSEESLRTAMRENASIYLEKDHEKNYKGFDPKNPDTYIILNMRENAFLDKSINLAKNVQDQFRTRVGRKDRGVKQAGYYVISFTNMPSILVELGFLTNADEEDFLHSDEGKTYMASAIYRAFRDFKEKESPSAKPPVDEPVKLPEAKTEKSEKPESKPTEATAPATTKPATGTTTENKPKPADKTPQPEVKQEPKQEVKVEVKPEVKPSTPKETTVASEKPKEEVKPAPAPKPAENPTGLVINKPSDVPSKNITKGVKFQIQILTSAKRLQPTAPEFKGIKNVEEYTHNGVYKYLSGTTDSYAEAKVIRDKVIEFGFKDAFIVAFEDNIRIDLAKAVNLSQKK
jgi:N-acetylmuramoyl-L-alanine amidase